LQLVAKLNCITISLIYFDHINFYFSHIYAHCFDRALFLVVQMFWIINWIIAITVLYNAWTDGWHQNWGSYSITVTNSQSVSLWSRYEIIYNIF